MKFTDINLDEELIAASRSIMEKKEPIIINPEMHNQDTVQRLQMGDEVYSDEEGKDSKDRQKDNKDKKHEFYEDSDHQHSDIEHFGFKHVKSTGDKEVSSHFYQHPQAGQIQVNIHHNKYNRSSGEGIPGTKGVTSWYHRNKSDIGVASGSNTSSLHAHLQSGKAYA